MSIKPTKAQLNNFECYIDSTFSSSSLDSLAKLTASSINGNILTPKGELRVLVIYAGFTNDKDKSGGFNPHTGVTDNSVAWPYYDLNGG